MPTRLRLQRHGRKKKPFYYIVVADARSPRDGKFIERLGMYNPTTNPATIEINRDKALEWLYKGAKPSDTVRAILSYKGVLYKKHLQKGVSKGALTKEKADKMFEEWVAQKESKIKNKRISILKNEEAERKKRLEAEALISEKRLAKRKPPKQEEPEETPTAETGQTLTDTVAEKKEEKKDTKKQDDAAHDAGGQPKAEKTKNEKKEKGDVKSK